MKTNAPMNSPLESLQKNFWRWLSLSVLALAVVSAAPAMSADVFIDEGDADFAPTPVTEGSKAPASESSAEPTEMSNDLDSAIGELSPPEVMDDVPSGDGLSGESLSLDEQQTAPVADAMPGAAPVMKSDAAAAPKGFVKAEKNAAKKEAKKEAKKATKKAMKKVAKKDAKKKAIKAKKKIANGKAKNKAAGKSGKARKVASSGKFAGGQYAVTSRECPMESAPGAGDVVGTTKVSKKLWVEESGNTSYWKVYGKAGNPAYVSRDCF